MISIASVIGVIAAWVAIRFVDELLGLEGRVRSLARELKGGGTVRRASFR